MSTPYSLRSSLVRAPRVDRSRPPGAEGCTPFYFVNNNNNNNDIGPPTGLRPHREHYDTVETHVDVVVRSTIDFAGTLATFLSANVESNTDSGFCIDRIGPDRYEGI